MDRENWQRRAKRAELSQVRLAKILGHAPNTITRQLLGRWQSGIPRHVKAAIVAWELMTDEQREAWQAELDRSG
jgi:hypothetical protein